MKKTKRIAVIYYNAGLGHLREAINVKQILESHETKVEIIDFNEIGDGIFLKVGEIYETMQRNGMARIASFSWWKNLPDFLVKFVNKIERNKEEKFTKKLESYLLKRKIDFVVATHFFPAGALAKSKHYNKKTINIVVDHLWKNTAWAYAVPGIKTIVPTEESYKNVYLNGKLGVKKKDLILAGHPFPPELIKEKDNMHKRRIKKYNTSEPLNILVTTGGAGTNEKEMMKILEGGKEEIKHNKVNLVLWCNHHSWLKEKLEKKAKKLKLDNCINLRIVSTKDKFSAVTGLHEEIKKADLLITKPGELAMYGGLAPLYLFEPTSSQEYSLADFGFKLGCAIPVKKINAKKIIPYANKNRKELKMLAEKGLKNPLIKMQEKNMLLNVCIDIFNKK